jgi:hypothetical protein
VVRCTILLANSSIQKSTVIILQYCVLWHVQILIWIKCFLSFASAWLIVIIFVSGLLPTVLIRTSYFCWYSACLNISEYAVFYVVNI